MEPARVERRPRFAASRAEREALAKRFFGAVVEGDIDGLVALLTEDVVVQGDGDRKAPQWSQPIAGAARAARLLAGVGGQMTEYGARLERHEVNGQPDRGGTVLCAPQGGEASTTARLIQGITG